MSEQETSFRSWGLLELMGRVRVAGELSEQTIGGCAFIRVDVPEVGKIAAHTRYFAPGSLYGMTPMDEATARKLAIYVGATGHGNIKLKDGTVHIKKITPKEGGAVDFAISFYTADVDAETLGDLGVLKSHELDIELTAPELISAKQADIEAGGDKTVKPIKTGKKGLGTDADQAERQAQVLAQDKTQAWPFPKPPKAFPATPEDALAHSAK